MALYGTAVTCGNKEGTEKVNTVEENSTIFSII